jgi:peptide/nickel transport system substrate-binding protein
MLTLKRACLLAAALLVVAGALPGQAQTLRIAMTASDVPTVGGIPDNGAEGYRFAGYPIYDALVNWDFSKPQELADLTPGLATSWEANKDDPRRWVFTLRKGVKFHDGTDFNADAVIWNFDRIFNDKAPNYDGAQAAIVKVSLPMLDKYEKIDDDHVVISTKRPFSPFPYLLTRILFVSPAQFAKVGSSWPAFGKEPAGTGPFKVTKVTPRVSVELARNEAYWDTARVPKLEKLVLIPMPEATTRLAALRSGQVDWIEVPPPDAIPSLKAAGFQISLKEYPHLWPWVLSMAGDSPFKDKRVRLAINYAIDRDGLVQLLNGTAKPAVGFYDPGHPAFGHPDVTYNHDPEKAKALLKEAGFGPDKPVKVKVMISTSGSGQMMPIPMNEFLQQNLKEVGFDVEFDVVDWGTMLVAFRNPPTSPMAHGDDAVNISLPFGDPTLIYRFFHGGAMPPNGSNWGNYNNPKVDKLLDAAFTAFDPAERDKLIGEAHAELVNDAAWLFIVHDLNPRAMSKNVKGFVPVQSWYQELTSVTVEK